jgi:hypothetical protein
MTIAEIDEMCRQTILPLPPAERLRLLARIAEDLSLAQTDDRAQPHSLLELDGLGADIWHGVEAQRYVDGLRGEWDG